MNLKIFDIGIVCLAMIVLVAQTSQAKIITVDVDYKDGDTVLQGYLAYDNSINGKRPGVLIIHEWNGLGSYVKMRAEEIAKLGYAAFCADIYGKGVRPANADESAKQAAFYRADVKLMRRRAMAGLEELKSQPMTDDSRVAVIGYCFGGGVALELARAGADISGVVVFHGNLDTPDPEDARHIKARILVLQGGADNYTLPTLPAFVKEMNNARVNWKLIEYKKAVHGFTNPANGNDPSKGVAYDEKADKESWIAMKIFFKEIWR